MLGVGTGIVSITRGAVRSIVNVFTDNGILVFHTRSVTVIVQSLYVHSLSGSKIIVLFPKAAFVEKLLQAHP
jgi:hypothetical protein